jgi:uncharacterized tellurite resistance protein B-like protein
MSRFKKAVKKKELESALSKHPLKELESQVKNDYIKGLVFIATEDENFHEDERSYITALMTNIGLDTALLEEFETFASSCEEDELLSFMDRLKEFDEDIKLNFLIEVIVISFKDGEFDDSEQEMFDDYLDMLELTERKDDIMYMALALVNKDIDLALSLYTAKKEFFNKFDYMFDMLDIDIEKELNSLYSWEWVEWRLSSGNIENNNLVASKPVTVRQFCVFLNSLVINSQIINIQNTDKFEFTDTKELMTADIYKININFESEQFEYSEEVVNNDFTGINETSITIFKDWINDKTNNNTKGLRIIADDYLIEFNESAKGFLTDNYEQFIAHVSYNSENDQIRFIYPSDTNYSRSLDCQCTLKLDVNYAFRLMKIEEEQK